MNLNLKRTRTSLVDDVINAFLKDVQAGEFVYGEKLPSQEELANRFQVSRIVLREALSKLSAIGMISFYQGKGTYLNKADGRSYISPEFSSLIFHDINNLRSIVEARQIVEKETSFLAAERKTSNDLLEIERTIQGMRDSINDKGQFGKWDLEFHIAVAKASNNPVLQKIIMLLSDSYRSEVVKFLEIPGILEKVLNEHESIFENIKDGNGEGASLIMSTHLELPEKVFLTKIAETEE
ncbi:FadR/GntR family transcriptional regulator [Alkalihalobacillus sp. AL-G]|uniref:FadR/GntR family transcriptional regulator n=1 Tax=Alkalihalobacillus sp. AL-G TaxID=2926399 RepID=UPI00272D387A|nr:FadR/GntR family transcriptional regulator [Alkalihalobacillus sp. AL-G]WLD93820.1 FadR family transcriptional regulator [Alkalihalobacillus sp. AL-G]